MQITIPERIKDLRVEHGLSLMQLEAKTGISKSALGYYESKDVKEISHQSIIKLAQFYEVSVDYLLCLTEQKNHSNADHIELHLSDEAVAVLKNGELNGQLLSEVIAHEKFWQLIADMEIYVDRIASMQIQNLNSLVDAARAEICSRYSPDEKELYLRTLDAAHIQEDEYFSHLIHNDMDQIVRDIRERHKSDTVTAPEKTLAQQLKEDFEEVLQFQGSKLEQLIMLFCKQTHISYRKLSEEEKVWLTRIVRKSEFVRKSHKRKCK